MDNISPASLKCNARGHSWTARSNNQKSPQCSKCRSRDIERIGIPIREDAGTSSLVAKLIEVDVVLNRFLRDFKALIYHLRGIDVMNDEWFYSQLITFCPYCNAANENGMAYSDETGRWTCRNAELGCEHLGINVPHQFYHYLIR